MLVVGVTIVVFVGGGGVIVDTVDTVIAVCPVCPVRPVRPVRPLLWVPGFVFLLQVYGHRRPSHCYRRKHRCKIAKHFSLRLFFLLKR